MRRSKQLKRVLPLVLGVLLVLGSAGTPAAAELPSIGDSSGTALTPDQERKLGESLMRRLRQELMIVGDPLVQDYIEALGYRLVANSEQHTHPFTFFVVDANDINAFAAPGGYIGINAGLLMAAESESELAAVMAHEIAHITQRHMARAYEAAGKYQWATAVALLAAMIVGRNSDQLAQAAIASGVAANAQLQIDFTRSNEEEADRLGIQILARSGFDPESMAAFFERLQKTSRLYGAQPPEFLSTHPVTVSRIADSRNRARQYPTAEAAENMNFDLVQARLRVLSGRDAGELEAEFAQNLKSGSYRSEAAERYGYVLVLGKNGKFDRAREEIKKLLANDPDRIAYRIAEAQLEMDRGNPDGALKCFEKALLLYPENHALVFHYAQALMASKKAGQAANLLQSYVRGRQPEAAIYQLYAQAAGDAGRLGEAYQQMAEYYFQSGQTHAAIEQLTRALRVDDLDFYRSSQIEARLQQLKAIALEENSSP